MPERGMLFVISGPSGSGKGTVIKRLFEKHSRIFYSVSATTRAPRENEAEGVNYYFLTQEEFKRSIAEGNMLEYAEFCGNFYGTPRTAVDERLDLGEDVILEIEVQGAAKVKKVRPDAVSVFLMPPSLKELEKRLRSRGTETEEKIKNRLGRAEAEMSLAADYDYIVINDIVDTAAEKISCIITAEKLKSTRYFGGNH